MRRENELIVFIALPPEPQVKEEAARLQGILRERVIGSYPAPENHHITLAYLGKIKETETKEVLQILASLTLPECELTFDKLEVFSGYHKEMIVFHAECPQELMAYRTALIEQLTKRGFSPDPAPFRPHITLVRAKTPGNDISGIAVRKQTMRAGAAVLFHSFHSRGQQVYLPIG